MSDFKSSLVIAIVGGGLGGICAALALGRAGHEVHLFEQASEFSEIGAGLNIGPNALHALEGTAPEVIEAYEKVADITEDGSLFFRIFDWKNGEHKFDMTTRGGRNSYVHRRRVLEVLIPFLPSNVKVEFSARVSHIENVEATFNRPAHVRMIVERAQKHHQSDSHISDSSDTTRNFEADAVIGCDGIKSAVRQNIGAHSVEGGTGQMRYSGTYAYRALLSKDEAIKVNGQDAMKPAMWYGPNKHILVFPVEHGTYLNLVALVSDRSKEENERFWDGPWVKPVDTQQMLDDFANWDERPRNLLKMIKKPNRWALHECVVLDHWTEGRITLLGDAAHASLPHNGAGAGQAIEDAYVLGEILRLPECTQETLPQFLLAYEAVRRPRASKQQVQSRESGEIHELASPMADNWAQLREAWEHRLDWLWAHDLSQDVSEAKALLKTQGML